MDMQVLVVVRFGFHFWNVVFVKHIVIGGLLDIILRLDLVVRQMMLWMKLLIILSLRL